MGLQLLKMKIREALFSNTAPHITPRLCSTDSKKMWEQLLNIEYIYF